jgi:hypothetical protein
MPFEIKKRGDRCHIPAFLKYVRTLGCCICGKASTASHMISVKWADGSDALAVNACMPDHHVQSTKVSRDILIRAGIDLEHLHRKLWNGFLLTIGVLTTVNTQQEFEELCEKLGLRKTPPTKRKYG